MVNISEQEFIELTSYIKANYGIQLKKEKRPLVVGRLQNVLTQNNFDSFTDYFKYLLADPSGEAITTLVNKITTNHTFFMREADHFHYLKHQALPHLVRILRDKDLRIWSAGCSSGEEPYTLAMILDEFLDKEKVWWDAKLLATDISEKSLIKAIKGVYDKERIAALPSPWRLKYFRQTQDGQWEVIDRIKREVIYRKFNLMDESFPFKKRFHIIFCRNVMIYFDEPTKRKLIQKFYDLTEPGGYLFIGHSESLSREKMLYQYVMPAVYRKL